MKNFFKKYIWLWEIIGAALILVLGILITFINGVLLTIIGTVFVFLGALRFIPLLQTTEDKLLKWLYGIEIIIDIFVGLVLAYLGITNPENNFMTMINENFSYIIAGIIYLRGFVYFFAISIRHEEHPKIHFYVHILLLTLGAFLFGQGSINLDVLKWIVFAVALLCCGFVSYAGIKNYKNYRNLYAAEIATKRIKKQKAQSPEIETPTSEEIDKTKINIDKIEDNNENEVNV